MTVASGELLLPALVGSGGATVASLSTTGTLTLPRLTSIQLVIENVDFALHDDGFTTVEVEPFSTIELVLDIFEPILSAAPNTAVVSVSGAEPNSTLMFWVDDRLVYSTEADSAGSLNLTSIPIPNLTDAAGNSIMTPGVHTLSVTQGGRLGAAEFTLSEPPHDIPELPGPDAPATDVPEATPAPQVRRWVFQDKRPGGLGSWVMPMNPVTMTSPPFVRELTVESTLAGANLGGQYHVYEDAYTPVEWTFEGYVPTKEMRDTLEAFADLNRRFYLIDHRARAWIVTFQELQLTPRLTQIWNGEYTDEGHDYTATVLVLDRNFQGVA